MKLIHDIQQQILSSSEQHEKLEISALGTDYTRLIIFSFFFGVPPPSTKFAVTHQRSRKLMAWVVQHKTHNSPNITSWIARKTEVAIAMEDKKTMTESGNEDAKNNQ